MCACRPCSASPSTRLSALDRLGGVGHREAELRVGLAGRDLLVGLAADVGGDPHQHRLAARAVAERALGDQPLEPLDLVEVVDHDQPHAVVAAPCAAPPRTWRCRASRSARARSRRAARGAARRRRPRRTTVPPARTAPAPRCRGRPWRRTPRGSPPGPRRAGRDEGARARAQVVLGDHVGGRAELARQLDRVAAADLEVAALVEAAAQRERRGRGSCRWPWRGDYRLPATVLVGRLVSGRAQRAARRCRRDAPAPPATPAPISEQRRGSRAAAPSARQAPRCCGG